MAYRRYTRRSRTYSRARPTRRNYGFYRGGRRTYGRRGSGRSRSRYGRSRAGYQAGMLAGMRAALGARTPALVAEMSPGIGGGLIPKAFKARPRS